MISGKLHAGDNPSADSRRENDIDIKQAAEGIVIKCIEALRPKLDALRSAKRSELERAQVNKDPKEFSRALGTFGEHLFFITASNVSKDDQNPNQTRKEAKEEIGASWLSSSGHARSQKGGCECADKEEHQSDC